VGGGAEAGREEEVEGLFVELFSTGLIVEVVVVIGSVEEEDPPKLPCSKSGRVRSFPPDEAPSCKIELIVLFMMR